MATPETPSPNDSVINLLQKIDTNTAEMVGSSGLYPAYGDNRYALLKKILLNLSVYASGGGVTTPTDLLHIIFIGQSNVLGGGYVPITTGTVPYGYMFAGGLAPAQVGLTSLVELREGQVTTTGETGAVSMVRWLRAYGGSHSYLVSNVGLDSSPYAGIKKGTTPYADSLAQVTAAKALATSMGLTYKVLCFVGIHGEADDTLSNTNYATDLATWQSDYEADVKAITGQAGTIPHIHAQMGASGALQFNSANFAGASSLNLQLANLANPTKVILASTESGFDFFSQPHFSAGSHAWVGEQMAKVAKKVCLDSGTFSPIVPLNATVVGSTIVVNFSVPVAPLRFNYQWSSYADGGGFRYDSSGGVMIPTAVALTGATQVTLTFASPPAGTSKRLSYCVAASIAKVDNSSNIRDSDATASVVGFDLSNILPAFAITVT